MILPLLTYDSQLTTAVTSSLSFLYWEWILSVDCRRCLQSSFGQVVPDHGADQGDDRCPQGGEGHWRDQTELLDQAEERNLHG